MVNRLHTGWLRRGGDIGCVTWALQQPVSREPTHRHALILRAFLCVLLFSDSLTMGMVCVFAKLILNLALLLQNRTKASLFF